MPSSSDNRYKKDQSEQQDKVAHDQPKRADGHSTLTGSSGSSGTKLFHPSPHINNLLHSIPRDSTGRWLNCGVDCFDEDGEEPDYTDPVSEGPGLTAQGIRKMWAESQKGPNKAYTAKAPVTGSPSGSHMEGSARSRPPQRPDFGHGAFVPRTPENHRHAWE